MAQFVNMRKVDLATGEPAVIALRQLYYADKEANRIGAIVMMNGEPFPLSGTCSGTAIRADGTTVPMTGTVEDNQSYITLIPDCYAVEGDIQIFVKLTTGDVTATLAAAVGTVRLTETNAVIDPGEIIPSVSALITAINDAVESIPADYSALLAAIAPNYGDLVYPVAAGTWCWYSGNLYCAIVDIPGSESWTAAHWETVPLSNAMAGDVADLKSAISIENDRTNELFGLINYGYNTPCDFPAGTTVSTRLAVKRNGTHVLLDGTTSTSGYCIVKLNNDVQRVSTSTQINELTNGTIFTEGHTYRVNMDVISGTAPSNSDLRIAVYKGGSHGNIATRVTDTEHHDCAEFTADGSSYMICVWTNKGITLTDLLLSVTMQDLADKSIYAIINDAINDLTVTEGTAWN